MMVGISGSDARRDMLATAATLLLDSSSAMVMFGETRIDPAPAFCEVARGTT